MVCHRRACRAPGRAPDRLRGRILAAETGWGWLVGINEAIVKIEGDASANTLVGGTAAEMLLGYDGADTVDGNGGDDRIAGGLGSDLLRGGGGNDHYIYAEGDGIDTVTDTSGARDVVYFGDGLTVASLVVERVGITGTHDIFVQRY